MKGAAAKRARLQALRRSSIQSLAEAEREQNAIHERIATHAGELHEAFLNLLRDVYEVRGYWTEGLDNTVRAAEDLLYGKILLKEVPAHGR